MVLRYNLEDLAKTAARLSKVLDLLNSQATDAELLSGMEYSWYLIKEPEVSWRAAGVDSSLALISAKDIERANYFMKNTDNLIPHVICLFYRCRKCGGFAGTGEGERETYGCGASVTDRGDCVCDRTWPGDYHHLQSLG